MEHNDFTTSIVVDKTPQEAFDAINNLTISKCPSSDAIHKEVTP